MSPADGPDTENFSGAVANVWFVRREGAVELIVLDFTGFEGMIEHPEVAETLTRRLGELNQGGPLQVEVARERAGLIIVLDREVDPDELVEKLERAGSDSGFVLAWHQALDTMPGTSDDELREAASALLQH